MSRSRNKTGRTQVVFQDENLLHTFCAALAQNDVPFAYGAGLSISMPQQAVKQFPSWLRTDFKKYEQDGKVQVSDQPLPSGRRRIPAPEEVRDALRQLLPKEFLPKA